MFYRYLAVECKRHQTANLNECNGDTLTILRLSPLQIRQFYWQFFGKNDRLQQKMLRKHCL